jgi:hypothetical protein
VVHPRDADGESAVGDARASVESASCRFANNAAAACGENFLEREDEL